MVKPVLTGTTAEVPVSTASSHRTTCRHLAHLRCSSRPLGRRWASSVTINRCTAKSRSSTKRETRPPTFAGVRTRSWPAEIAYKAVNH